ncbi:hypothetical protein NM688_g5053 [Phlebia brevispora]|uniref:Uncharacterized protein n=1 Tax=Phlebia brevispora TaxID=194682 RepID=A0ACC1T188_9APHY|nr:hypothetical protein NM688_g5053 [Phlebia brevispora]
MDTSVQVAVPDVLKGAWSMWSTASQLYDTVKCRQKELKVLLQHCHNIIVQVADYYRDEIFTESLNSTTAIIKRIETELASVKNIVTQVNEGGFLWGLMNASKLDEMIEGCEQRLKGLFTSVEQALQFDRKQQICRAREDDRRSLEQILEHSSSTYDFLGAVQSRETVHRTGPEIVVALRKHMERNSSENSSRIEDVFIQRAFDILYRLDGVRTTVVLFESFIISSVDVKFDATQSIGEGYFGKVFKGKWEGISVAIKQMNSLEGRMLSEQRQAFHHEVKTWSELRHPNVLSFYGVCLEAESPFLLMKYCAFGTICNYLYQHPDADRVRLSHEVSAGLAYLHNKKIVHADIKGANVLVDEGHHALLSDFGLALKLQQYRRTAFSQELDTPRGTKLFMAPEVLRRERSPDEVADVYSLGLTIWQIFSDGVLPYSRYLDVQFLVDGVAFKNSRESRPERLTQDKEHVWRTIQKCWASKREDRPSAKMAQYMLKYVSCSDYAAEVSPSSSSNLTLPKTKDNSPRPEQRHTVRKAGSVGQKKHVVASKSDNYQISISLPINSFGTTSQVSLVSGVIQQSSTQKETTVARERDSTKQLPTAPPPSRSRPLLRSSSSRRSTTSLPRPLSSAKSDSAAQRSHHGYSPKMNGMSSGTANPTIKVDTTASLHPPRKDGSLSPRDANVLSRSLSCPPGSKSDATLLPDIHTAPSSPKSGRSKHLAVERANTTSSTRRLSGSSAGRSSPNRSPPKLSSVLDKFLEVTDYRKTYTVRDLEEMLEEIRMRSSQFISACTSSDIPRSDKYLHATRMVLLPMYRHIIYCDDSDPGTKESDPFPLVKTCARYTANVGLSFVPDERGNIEMRFVNSDNQIVGRGTHFRAIHGANEDSVIHPKGHNKLGTGLQAKILQPLVYDVLRKNGGLERPLLVSVYTNSPPQEEAKTTFRDAVVECKARLAAAKCSTTAVLFVVFRIGSVVETRDFVDELREDPELADVLYCPRDSLRYAESIRGSGTDGMEKWVVEMLAKPILRLEGM